jgi:hypothetical protein
MDENILHLTYLGLYLQHINEIKEIDVVNDLEMIKLYNNIFKSLKLMSISVSS